MLAQLKKLKYEHPSRKIQNQNNETRTPVGFCSRTPSVPRASIIWLAPAVKVVRLNFVASTLTAFATPSDGT
jgi:hypothetical protein